MDDSDKILWVIGSVFSPFVIAYAVAYYFKHQKTQQEIIWEKNRKSMIWYSLSTIENETIHMRSAYGYLEMKNIDVSQETVYFTFTNTGLVNHERIQEQIGRLPTVTIALGYMTHEQYTAITDYLENSLDFMKSLENGIYQGWLLKSRVEKARKIFVLFQKEIEEFNGLKIWKEYFQSN
ncbi:MAG: hypothetical protein WBF38_03855 [Nitrosotalea sp.]